MNKTILIQKLEDLCSRREYCRKEMFDKAVLQGCTTAEAREIVDLLVEHKFVDDRRYTEAYVKDKLRFNRWGRVKIAFMLRSQNIDRSIVADVLSEIDETEYNKILTGELQKKIKTGLRGNVFETKGKLYRFATGRGFESEVVSEAIGKLL